MKLKTVASYHINFQSKWISVSGFFTGLSFLLLAVKYFGIENLNTIGAGEVVVCMVLPMLILTVYGVSLCGFKFQAAPLYGIVCCSYCVFLIIQTLAYGLSGGVLAVIWYVLAALVALATAFGFLPSQVFAFFAFILPTVYRLFFVDPALYFQTKDWSGFLPEAAMLCGMLAFSAFALCLQKKRK